MSYEYSRYDANPSKEAEGTSTTSLQELFIISPIILVFILGIYLGSISVAHKTNHGHLSSMLTSAELPYAAIEGLPGTKNVLTVRDQHSMEGRKIAQTDKALVAAPQREIATRTIDPPVEKEAVKTVTKTFGTASRSKTMNNGGHTAISTRGHLRGQSMIPVSKSSPSDSMSRSSGSSLSTGPPYSKSFHATASNAMTASTSLDNEIIVVGAWIYLDPDDDTNDKDMRTIFTNKVAGCDNHAEQYGLSLYVNAWQQHDHKLYVEYGSTQAGVIRLLV